MKLTRKQRAELDALKKLMQIQKDEAIKEGIARNRAEIQAELPALYAKQRGGCAINSATVRERSTGVDRWKTLATCYTWGSPNLWRRVLRPWR